CDATIHEVRTLHLRTHLLPTFPQYFPSPHSPSPQSSSPQSSPRGHNPRGGLRLTGVTRTRRPSYRACMSFRLRLYCGWVKFDGLFSVWRRCVLEVSQERRMSRGVLRLN